MEPTDLLPDTGALLREAHQLKELWKLCPDIALSPVKSAVLDHLTREFPRDEDRARAAASLRTFVNALSGPATSSLFATIARTQRASGLLGTDTRNFTARNGAEALRVLCDLIPNADAVAEATSKDFLDWLTEVMRDGDTRCLLEQLGAVLTRGGRIYSERTPEGFSLRKTLEEMGVGSETAHDGRSSSPSRPIPYWRLILAQLSAAETEGAGRMELRFFLYLVERSRSPRSPVSLLEEFAARVHTPHDMLVLKAASPEELAERREEMLRGYARSEVVTFPRSPFGYRSRATADWALAVALRAGRGSDLARVVNFCSLHGGGACLEGPHPCPFMDILGAEKGAPDRARLENARSELANWSTVVSYLTFAEIEDGRTATQEDLRRLVELARRSGSSITLVAEASLVARGPKDHEDVLSGERGRIKQMVQRQVGRLFPGLQRRTFNHERMGGAERLRRLLEYRKFFEDHPVLLGEGPLLDRLAERRRTEFDEVRARFPNWFLPFSFTRGLTVSPDRKSSGRVPEELVRLIGLRTERMLEDLFPTKLTPPDLRPLVSALQDTLGKKLRQRLSGAAAALPAERSWEARSLRQLSRVMLQIKPDLELWARREPSRFEIARNPLNRVVAVLADALAEVFRQERLVDLDPKDPFELREALEWARQYIEDPNLHGWLSPEREEIINGYAPAVRADLENMTGLSASGGALTFCLWDRELDDIFAGRSSGDCTAPGGMLFEHNFEWIEDPGTMMLNIFLQPPDGSSSYQVGRAYLFAVFDGGHPGVFLDSMEVVASLREGPQVRHHVSDALRALAHHFNAPIFIPEGRISNRGWVSEAVKTMDLPHEKATLEKLGDDVTIERDELIGSPSSFQVVRFPRSVS